MAAHKSQRSIKAFKPHKNRLIFSTGPIVLVVFAGIGVFLLITSHAATPYIASTADKGTHAGTTTTGACTGATDGNCVTLGTAPSTGTGAPPIPTVVPTGYTRLFTEDFNTAAPLGQFDNVYGGEFGEYPDTPPPQPDGTEAEYQPTEVLSVSNGSLYYDLHTDSNGVPVAAAPQPMNGQGFLYGQVGVAVKLDSQSGPQNYKIAFLMWPTGDNGAWTDEVDFAETQTNFAQDFAVNSLYYNPSGNDSTATFDMADGNPDTGVNLGDDKYHVFLVTWTPTALTVSIDGVTMATFPESSGADPAQDMRVSLQSEGWYPYADAAISPASTATIEVPWFYINQYN